MSRNTSQLWVSGIVALSTFSVVALGGRPSWKTAVVPESLAKSPAYLSYAKTLIQIDLLANPTTASLPVAVECPEAGLIVIRGRVGSEPVRQYILANARRISGLTVRDEIRVTELSEEKRIEVAADELEVLTSETLAALFPRLSEQIRTTVTGAGIVVLNGRVPSYDAKLQLSQAVKSQPGCQAVVNLVMVPANPETGKIALTENRQVQLEANKLPIIPAAPLVDLKQLEKASPGTAGSPGSRGAFGDDAPDGDLLDRQLLEEVRAQLSRNPDSARAGLEVDVRFGVVYITGDLKRRKQVESVVESIAELPDANKIVAQCRPFSIQCNLPYRGGDYHETEQDQEQTENKPHKRFGLLSIPYVSHNDSDQEKTASWWFRERLRRSIQKRCGKRLTETKVRPTLDGLVIEGEVKSPRDRSFVFRQVDELLELRDTKYQLVLRVLDE